MSNKKEKIIVLSIGFFVIILLLEVGLRVIGYVHFKRAAFDEISLSYDRETHYTILCLGDSFTVGIGALRGNNYPRQLERLLNLRAKREVVKVINRGLGGYNTRQVLNKLQGNIDTMKPDLIILLAGGANRWNYYGYNTYLKGENLFSKLNDRLYRIRVYKLIKLLFHNIKSKIKDKLLFIELKNNNPNVDRYCNSGKLGYANSRFDTTDGQVFIDRKDYQEAIRWFKKGIEVNPSDGSNYCGMGWSYRDQGDYQEARRWFKKGIEVNPSDGSNYCGMGWLYRIQRDYQEARRWFKKGIEVNPNDGSNYCGMGWLYRDQGDYQEAIRWFKKGIEVNPSDGSNYCGMGWSYRVQGDYQEARRWFKKGIEVNPCESSNYCGIGWSYRVQRDYQEAIRWFRKGIEVNPSDGSNYCGMGWSYRVQGDYQEARRWFKKGIEVNPSESSNYCGMGNTYREQGDHQEARRWFKKGIEVNPSESSNYCGMGNTYREQGDHQEAIRWFRKGIEVNPSDNSNYYDRGDMYRDRKDYQEARRWFKKGIEVNPSEGSNYCGMGNTYREQGDHQEAIRWFRKGIEVNPSNINNYENFSSIYIELPDSIKREEYVKTIDLLHKLAKNNSFVLNYIQLFKKENMNREITKWVKSDIEKIIKICQGEEIKIIVQNYPEDKGVNGIIRKAAKEYPVIFIDNECVFAELREKGEKREDYFIPDGHCNNKGYGVMAENIHEKIVKEELVNMN